MEPGTKENQAINESGGASEPLPGDAATSSGSSTETTEIPAGATDGGNPADKETDSSLNEETSSDAEEKNNSDSIDFAVNLPALRDAEEENSKADTSNKVDNPQKTKQSECEVSEISHSEGPAAARVAAANSANTAIPKGWERVFGQDEFDTMQAISKKGWADDSCSTVVVVTVSGYWDALSASPLAGVLNCPVLLSKVDSLPTRTYQEVRRLGSKKVYIIGGPLAISESVAAKLRRQDYEIVRLGGIDYQETSRIVADEVHRIDPSSTTCVIATSRAYQDALSIAPYTYWSKSPIFLTDSNGTRSHSERLLG